MKVNCYTFFVECVGITLNILIVIAVVATAALAVSDLLHLIRNWSNK